MSKSTTTTPATRALTAAGVPFTAHPYVLPRETAEATYGEAVAAVLGVEADRVFKTLIATVDGAPVVAIVPTSGRLHEKTLAAAASGKRAALAEPADAERWTGFLTGGVSPFGQRRRLPCYVDDRAFAFATIYTSGGRRDLEIEFAPAVLRDVLGAVPVPDLAR